MNNMKRKLSSFLAAAALAVSCTMGAFAAGTTYQDVVKSAGQNGVPANNIAELKNYLMANQKTFTEEDYDYMISQLDAAGDILREATGISDLTTLSDGELRAKIKALDPDTRSEIQQIVIETGATFGVTISFDQKDPTTVLVTAGTPKSHSNGEKVKENTDGKGNNNPQIQTGGDKKAAATGACCFDSEEALAAIAVGLAALGFAVTVKLNKKAEEE